MTREGGIRALRILLWLCLIAVVAFIFSNSATVGEVSDLNTEEALSYLSGSPLDFLDAHLLRKLGHVGEFLLLGLVLALDLRLVTGRPWRYLAWPLLFGLLVALGDETFQLSVPGRSGLLTDVWIDLGGVSLGILMGLGITRLTPGFWRRVAYPIAQAKE